MERLNQNNDLDTINPVLQNIVDQTNAQLPSLESMMPEQSVLNIIDFISQTLKLSIWRRQRIILKIFYNLKLTEDEEDEIRWLFENKNIIIPENYQDINFKELIIVAGRRGSKSVLAALIAAYEVYCLLSKYNPVQYYGLISGTKIYILHCAAKEDQAKHVQDYFKGYIRGSEWFQPYIDRILEKEVRFFTDYNKEHSADKGTVRFTSLTSNSATMAGATAKMVILDELARMMDTGGRLSGNKIYQALTPSIATFKSDGKIVDISSPLTKGGVFYDLYQKSFKIESMLCFQYASWELNENLSFEDLKDEFDKNPEWAKMEYGGEFGEVLDSAFDWDKVDKMKTPGISFTMSPVSTRSYVICCDPATKNDRYGIAWGHKEIQDGNTHIYIDGLKFFESETIMINGEKSIVEVDLEMVDRYVVALAGRLVNVSLIAYDQGKSTASIQKLKKRGLRVEETTFTSKYKETLYNDVNAMLNQERLHVYESDPQNAVDLLIDEMKHLERQVKGNTIHVGHPLVGHIQTDDLYDCVSNCVHLLLEDNPRKILQRTSAGPVIVRTRNIG